MLAFTNLLTYRQDDCMAKCQRLLHSYANDLLEVGLYSGPEGVMLFEQYPCLVVNLHSNRH